jgi:hypothetical protein
MKKDKINQSVQPDLDCGIYEEKESLPYPNPISKHQTDINIGWMRAMKYMKNQPIKDITDEDLNSFLNYLRLREYNFLSPILNSQIIFDYKEWMRSKMKS